MGYHRMTAEKLRAIWVRLNVGDSHRGIAELLGLDKKTVNLYEAKIRAAGMAQETPLAEALPVLHGLLDGNRKASPALFALEPFREEIRALICGDRNLGRQPMKAKTAWFVLKELHSLDPVLVARTASLPSALMAVSLGETALFPGAIPGAWGAQRLAARQAASLPSVLMAVSLGETAPLPGAIPGACGAPRPAAAGFSSRMTFEVFNYKFNAAVLPAPTLRDLASCRFIDQRRNLVLAGPPGIGKSHIA